MILRKILSSGGYSICNPSHKSNIHCHFAAILLAKAIKTYSLTIVVAHSVGFILKRREYVCYLVPVHMLLVLNTSNTNKG